MEHPICGNCNHYLVCCNANHVLFKLKKYRKLRANLFYEDSTDCEHYLPKAASPAAEGEKVKMVYPCPKCNGDGYTAEHAPNCDGSCRKCPVQVQCEECCGTGRIEQPPAIEATQPTNEESEIFESLNRLEYCSPKSQSWIAENAKFLRKAFNSLCSQTVQPANSTAVASFIKKWDDKRIDLLHWRRTGLIPGGHEQSTLIDSFIDDLKKLQPPTPEATGGESKQDDEICPKCDNGFIENVADVGRIRCPECRGTGKLPPIG